MGTLKNVADQLSASLETIHFYNYGEPFLNKQADDMLLYLREKCPGALIVTSTNGIPLSKPSRAAKVVLAVPDRVIFTISGITQEVYGRYHAAGKCELALLGLKNVCDAKRESGQTRLTVIVRYLVFHWNDSDEQIDGVVALAKEYGVDQLKLFLTDEPPGARSVRFSPGSPSYFKYKKHLHFDHLGRLDHLYHCELPDEDGMFQFEEIQGFGKVRRTGSEATVRCKDRNGRIRLSISTDRPISRTKNQLCLVQTPWKAVEVTLTFGKWETVSFRVPRALRGCGPVEVKLSTQDFWFPAEECANSDLRCLGVLFRAKPLIESGTWRFRYLYTLASLKRFWRRRISVAIPRQLRSFFFRHRWANMRVGTQVSLPDEVVLDTSVEARPISQSITRLFWTVFGRSPECEDLRDWTIAIRNDRCSTIQLAQDFVSSTEFRKTYGADPSPEAFVAAACRNVPRQVSDAIDGQSWIEFLTRNGNGKSAKAATALGIANTMTFVNLATVMPVDSL